MRKPTCGDCLNFCDEYKEEICMVKYLAMISNDRRDCIVGSKSLRAVACPQFMPKDVTLRRCLTCYWQESMKCPGGSSLDTYLDTPVIQRLRLGSGCPSWRHDGQTEMELP